MFLFLFLLPFPFLFLFLFLFSSSPPPSSLLPSNSLEHRHSPSITPASPYGEAG
jgi:hypothetical protein